MDRKQLIRQYKERRPDMGVYALKSGVSGVCYMGCARDLRAIINRHTFMLSTGSHDNRAMLEDWTANKDSFESLVLETLEYDKKAPGRDYTEDLKTLLELWIEKTDSEVVLL